MMSESKDPKKRSLDQLLKGNAKLPTPPVIAIRIMKKTKEENLSFSELEEIIASDPALTIKILSIANSPVFGSTQTVDSISRAINILGVNAIRNIALSFVIASSFRCSSKDGFDYDLFWKNALTRAVAANILGRLLRRWSDDVYICALLADIGKVVMFMSRPDDYLTVHYESNLSDSDECALERSVFGFDHQEIGYEVLRRWGIPDSICLPIAHHHVDDGAPKTIADIVGILEIADYVSAIYHGKKGSGKMRELRDLVGKRIGTGTIDVDSFVDEAAIKTSELLSAYELSSEQIKTYSQLLQEANEELSKMNVSYEQIVLELMEEKKRAEDLAQELKDMNRQLRDLAFVDSLTGLYNRRFLAEILMKDFEKSRRYRHPLSISLIDVDDFKKVNDTFGHVQGDVVLRSIARCIRDSIRSCDTAARFGGEEFLVLMPETDLKSGAIFAERLRKKIEATAITLENDSIRITISIGVSTLDPANQAATKEHLLDAADRALYQSKKTGKNKVSVIPL